MYTGPNILVIKYFLWKINTEISDLKSALITVSFKRNGVIHEKTNLDIKLLMVLLFYWI